MYILYSIYQYHITIWKLLIILLYLVNGICVGTNTPRAETLLQTYFTFAFMCSVISIRYLFYSSNICNNIILFRDRLLWSDKIGEETSKCLHFSLYIQPFESRKKLVGNFTVHFYYASVLNGIHTTFILICELFIFSSV